ncbi:MAG: SGNH/GDSL hydrolase family protein [Sodalinema sp.]|uniref:SGNH/GDSL hydrolase family protein n=1 Tax=Sodalinema sp. TaxID=3080550 RepID=UPI00396F42DF
MNQFNFLSLFSSDVSTPLKQLRQTAPPSETFSIEVTVSDVTTTSAELETNSREFLAVEYSLTPDFETIAGIEIADPEPPSDGRDVDLDIDLTGLTPNQTYYYRLTDAQGNSERGRFETLVDVGLSGTGDFVVFGDSLSDTGNLFLALDQQQPPSPPYFQGRFSNGPILPEWMAERLGVAAPIPALAGGNNYAFAGAQTGPGTLDNGAPNVGQQIEAYLSQDRPESEDLFYLSAGANDLIFGQRSPEAIADHLTDHISTLAEAGAQQFLISNLPDIGQLPAVLSQGQGDVLTGAVLETNQRLDARFESLEQQLGIDILELDFAGAFEEILQNPQQFGFTNTTESALDPLTGEVVDNPEEYLFWDEIHPSTRTHELITRLSLTELQSLEAFALEEAEAPLRDLELFDSEISELAIADEATMSLL